MCLAPLCLSFGTGQHFVDPLQRHPYNQVAIAFSVTVARFLGKVHGAKQQLAIQAPIPDSRQDLLEIKGARTSANRKPKRRG